MHADRVPGWRLFFAMFWRRERVLTACALLAFALAGVNLVAAAVRGSWSVPPEGRLLDAFKFETGVGIYFLTLALLVPLSGMTPRARSRWVGCSAVVAVYFVLIETVQAVRGLDPRFTAAGTSLDQAAGAAFGVAALLVVVLFAILAQRFFRDDVLADHPSLRTAIRYGIAATMFAFGSGLVMTVIRMRFVAETGNLMPLHAAGFHGLQAVPLVALLAGASALDGPTRRHVTHTAGVAWLVLCTSLLLQALSGSPLLAATPAAAMAATAFLTWASCLCMASHAFLRRRFRESSPPHSISPPQGRTGPP